MTAPIISLRATRAAFELQRAGWRLQVARDFCDALEALPCSVNRFAHARRVLRGAGVTASQTRELLVRLGYLDVERCSNAACGRRILTKQCRVVLHGASYCGPSCLLDGLERVS